jgi:hypothetical protein
VKEAGISPFFYFKTPSSSSFSSSESDGEEEIEVLKPW